MFLKNLQNCQENTCVGISFLNKTSDIQPVVLLKKRLQGSCLTEKLPMTASGVYPWILRRFSECLFIGHLLGDCLFHVQVAEFQPTYIIINYFIVAFQEFGI